MFEYPRSHSGWIGPIGEVFVSGFIPKSAYRCSIWRRRLAFLMPYRTSRIVACLLYALTVFCIPQVPFRLNWANRWIWSGCIYTKISLPVFHPSFPWLAFISWLAFIWRNRLAFLMPFRTSRKGWLACLLYALTVFCISQVPFRLNWANWRDWWG